jgi:hypothetical protein
MTREGTTCQSDSDGSGVPGNRGIPVDSRQQLCILDVPFLRIIVPAS